MQLPVQAERLRIFIGENDRVGSKLLMEVVIEEARKEGLAGATALRGISGYGANSLVHSSKILRLSEDMPVIIEIVDSVEKIEAFLPKLDGLIKEGLVTKEPVEVLMYRHTGG